MADFKEIHGGWSDKLHLRYWTVHLEAAHKKRRSGYYRFDVGHAETSSPTYRRPALAESLGWGPYDPRT